MLPPIDSFTPPALPEPLPPKTELKPPMRGTAEPFRRVDGQNRDIILEALRQWGRDDLFAWAERWGDYWKEYGDDQADWIDTWVTEANAYLESIGGGVQGPAGPQGPQGVAGPTGPAGPAGVNGTNGATGPQGPTGAVGPQGAAGAVGPAGPQGPVGAAGVNGVDGVNGAEGPRGAAGATGEQGPRGPEGPSGAAGPAGPAGVNGVDGVQGAQGPVGPTGAAGPQGIEGPAGSDGTNGLFDTWVASVNEPPLTGEISAGITGFKVADTLYFSNTSTDGSTFSALFRLLPVGTVISAVAAETPDAIVRYATTGEFVVEVATSHVGVTVLETGVGDISASDTVSVLLSSPALPGPRGPQGTPGVAGPAGPTGPAGPQGTAGVNGVDGAAGEQGPVGPAGAEGPRGETGLQGPAGEQGPAGRDGVDGVAGAPGAVGPVGPQGPQGDAGPIGPVGPEGPAGAAGQDGSVGAQGPAGPAGPVGPEGPQGLRGIRGTGGLYDQWKLETVADASGEIAINGTIIVSNTSNLLGNFTGLFGSLPANGSETRVTIQDALLVDRWVRYTVVNAFPGAQFLTLTYNNPDTIVGPGGAPATGRVVNVLFTVAGAGVPGPAGAQGVPGPEGPEGPQGPAGSMTQRSYSLSASGIPAGGEIHNWMGDPRAAWILDTTATGGKVWFRAYLSEADRVADAGRDINTPVDPSKSNGIICDIILENGQLFRFTPPIMVPPTDNGPVLSAVNLEDYTISLSVHGNKLEVD